LIAPVWGAGAPLFSASVKHRRVAVALRHIVGRLFGLFSVFFPDYITLLL